jgi:hypothetical protein
MNLDEFIDSQTNAFNLPLNKMQRDLFKILQKELMKLATRDGVILDNEANIQIAAGLNKKIQNALKDIKFTNLVERFLDNFDEINKDIEKTQKGEKISVPTNVFKKWKNIKREEVITALLTSGIDANFSTPIRQLLNNRIGLGASLLDTITALQDTIEGDPQRLGSFEKYVTQISRDTLRNYTGSVNANIATLYDLNAYRYVGSIVKDSREQCIRWTSMDYILMTDLQDEIDWAYNNGTGMIPNTTPENFAQNCGGYNCRHVAIPIRVEVENK